MINLNNKKKLLCFFCVVGHQNIHNSFAPPIEPFGGMNHGAMNFGMPPMAPPMNTFNNAPMGQMPVVNRSNQFEQKNNGAPSTTTILWSQEQNRTNNTIRYNWYFRQKTTRNAYYLYEQVVIIIDEIEQFISEFNGHVGDIKSLMTEHIKKIKAMLNTYNAQINDVAELLPQCTEFIQSLNILNNDDFTLHNKEFKSNIVKAIYDLENIQILIKSVENDTKLINSALQQSYATSRTVQEQKTYVQSLESKSWEQYQKLDELISDSQVREISNEISNSLENAKQVKAFLESDVKDFINTTKNNITNALNTTSHNVEQIINELIQIKNKIEELHTLKTEELKIQQEKEELEKQEKEKNEEIEKKKAEDLRIKKMLLARPWYKKIYQDKILKFFNAIGNYHYSNLYHKPIELFKNISFINPLTFIKNTAINFYEWIGSLTNKIFGTEENKNKKKIITNQLSEEQNNSTTIDTPQPDLIDKLAQEARNHPEVHNNTEATGVHPFAQHNEQHPAPFHRPPAPFQPHNIIPPTHPPMNNMMMHPMPETPMMNPMQHNNNIHKKQIGAHPKMVSNTSQDQDAMKMVFDVQTEQINENKMMQEQQRTNMNNYQEKQREQMAEAQKQKLERTPMFSTETFNNNQPQEGYNEPENYYPHEENNAYQNQNTHNDDLVAMEPDNSQPFVQDENNQDNNQDDFNNSQSQQPSHAFNDDLITIDGVQKVGSDMDEGENEEE